MQVYAVILLIGRLQLCCSYRRGLVMQDEREGEFRKFVAISCSFTMETCYLRL